VAQSLKTSSEESTQKGGGGGILGHPDRYHAHGFPGIAYFFLSDFTGKSTTKMSVSHISKFSNFIRIHRRSSKSLYFRHMNSQCLGDKQQT
jgi:hypothetical protein